MVKMLFKMFLVAVIGAAVVYACALVVVKVIFASAGL